MKDVAKSFSLYCRRQMIIRFFFISDTKRERERERDSAERVEYHSFERVTVIYP